jgi:hypothetical protein
MVSTRIIQLQTLFLKICPKHPSLSRHPAPAAGFPSSRFRYNTHFAGLLALGEFVQVFLKRFFISAGVASEPPARGSVLIDEIYRRSFP